MAVVWIFAGFLISCGGSQPVSKPQSCCTPVAISLPLHVQGQWIVDDNNQRLKLAGVNWYGAEEQDHVVAGLQIADLNQIAAKIKALGFNSVRLPWSNEMYETNPPVGDLVVAANPHLKGLHAMEVFDSVVNALANQGLLVILDNHVSTADWCCSNTDGNQLWYNSRYPQTAWLADWQGMAQRYRTQPAVVAVDLRNEPRATATWGGDPQYDWHAAAQLGGNTVLGVNPTLLVMVEGINYASDLTGVAKLPVTLNVPNHVVYSVHDYSWYHNGLSSYAQLQQQLDQAWGYILAPSEIYTAPVWIGEYGTCHTNSACLQDSTFGSQGFWFSSFLLYLKQKDIDWNYWALNGTQATGMSRTFGAEETYGVLDMSWLSPAGPPVVSLLQTLQGVIPASQGPGVGSR
jgi:endoglucanase